MLSVCELAPPSRAQQLPALALLTKSWRFKRYGCFHACMHCMRACMQITHTRAHHQNVYACMHSYRCRRWAVAPGWLLQVRGLCFAFSHCIIILAGLSLTLFARTELYDKSLYVGSTLSSRTRKAQHAVEGCYGLQLLQVQQHHLRVLQERLNAAPPPPQRSRQTKKQVQTPIMFILLLVFYAASETAAAIASQCSKYQPVWSVVVSQKEELNKPLTWTHGSTLSTASHTSS